LQKQKWALAGKEYVVDDENEESLEHTPSNSHLDDEREEELTVKPSNNPKSSRDAILERKMKAADARGQMFTSVEDSQAYVC
jgi:hypothetical protein